MSKHKVRRQLAKIQKSNHRHHRRTSSPSEARRRLVRQWLAAWPYVAAVRRILIDGFVPSSGVGRIFPPALDCDEIRPPPKPSPLHEAEIMHLPNGDFFIREKKP